MVNFVELVIVQDMLHVSTSSPCHIKVTGNYYVGLKQTIRISQYSFEIMIFIAKKQILYSKCICV